MISAVVVPEVVPRVVVVRVDVPVVAAGGVRVRLVLGVVAVVKVLVVRTTNCDNKYMYFVGIRRRTVRAADDG